MRGGGGGFGCHRAAKFRWWYLVFLVVSRVVLGAAAHGSNHLLDKTRFLFAPGSSRASKPDLTPNQGSQPNSTRNVHDQSPAAYSASILLVYTFRFRSAWLSRPPSPAFVALALIWRGGEMWKVLIIIGHFRAKMLGLRASWGQNNLS